MNICSNLDMSYDSFMRHLASATLAARTVWRPRLGKTEGCRRCGHDFDVHRHLRPGLDCSLCECTGFRRSLRGKVE